jgi:DnaJ-class molecular chaperone
MANPRETKLFEKIKNSSKPINQYAKIYNGVKPFEFVKTERCKQCKGQYAAGTCKRCLDGAVTLRSKNKNIILPAGLAHNSMWKSENELVASPGGQQFDLYIRVQINNKFLCFIIN